MKAIQIDNYGGPETLTLRDIPAPAAGAGQVVVRVYATSYNPIDFKLASGAMKQMMPLTFPWTPGGDFSGVVESIGDNVTTVKVGDEVYGTYMPGGAYADLIAVPADSVALKPRSISHVEAASLAIVAQTALQALDAGDLKSGQTVLIHGASGGVGSAAVQLAHGRGAHVIATASGDTAALTVLGADQVIDYKTTKFEDVAKNVDVVIDGVGGETQARSFGVLKPGGVLVTLSQPASQEEAAKHNIKTVMVQTQSSNASLTALAEQVDAGKIKPTVGKVYLLAEAATAWAEWPGLHIPGKMVFVVSEG